jgi:hypothetical protein
MRYSQAWAGDLFFRGIFFWTVPWSELGRLQLDSSVGKYAVGLWWPAGAYGAWVDDAY